MQEEPTRPEVKKLEPSASSLQHRRHFIVRLQQIGDAFRLPGEVKKFSEIKDSRVSITYKVTYSTNKDYIFQKFVVRGDASVKDVMHNIDLITNHLHDKNLSSLHFHHTNFKENFVVDEDGNNWRVVRYFDATSFDKVEDPELIKQFGRALGSFQLSFVDFDVSKLAITMPDFHDVEKLVDDAKDDTEIGIFLEQAKEKAAKLNKLDLPIRVNHNNIKINHFLFNRQNEPSAIISLDMAMPGIGLYDFAHTVNDLCWDGYGFDWKRLSSYLEGYLSVGKAFLEESEIEAIPLSLFAAAVETASVDYKKYRKYGEERKLKDTEKYIAIAKFVEANEQEIKKAVSEARKASSKNDITLNSFQRDLSTAKEKKTDYKVGQYMHIHIPHTTKVKGGKAYAFFKRAFDIFASFMALLLLSWLLLIIGLIVVLTSKGPMIYVSKRVGKNGKIFNFYKFRSMYKDADKKLDELLSQNEVKDGVIFKIKNDPRITPVGKFLRKTSLDELPQLVNILRGDMSIIGPRVGLPREVEQYPEEALDRLLVPQGLSGEWQVNGRSTTTFDDMVKMDLDYIQNKRSFWYDIKLIFKTVGVVLKGKGAE